MKVRKLVMAAAVAAMYAVLTVILAPFSFGVVQVRISEALTVLPAVSPVAIWGIFVGCLIANIYTGSIIDIIFGSLTTLAAGILTYKLRKSKWLVPLPPVLLNAVIVGGYLSLVSDTPWYINMLTVGAGQLISCYVLGLPFLMLVKKNKYINEYLK